MNSEIVAANFASGDKMLYGAHYITLVSDISYENNEGQFVMTYATPNASTKPKIKTLPKISTRNVVNKEDVKISKVSTSNYITLTVPKHFFYITKLEIETDITHCSSHGGVSTCNPQIIITRKEYKKGQKFVAVNAGGDVDKPCIVGVV